MKQSLQLKLSQHLALTPQLQQSIRLLQLSTLELNQELEQILAENPLLERLDDPLADCARIAPNGSLVDGATPASAGPDAPDGDAPPPERVDAGPEPERGESDGDGRELGDHGLDWGGEGRGGRGEDGDDDREFAQVSSGGETLRDHLMRQLAGTGCSPRDRALVTVLVDELDGDGYLRADLDELLQALPPELGIEAEELSAALRLLQSFDPPGIGARSVPECLLLQLGALTPSRRPPDATLRLAAAIARNHLELLAARDFARLKRLLRCDDDQLRAAQTVIQALHPRPGNAFAGEPPAYVVPDVVVRRLRGGWQAMLNPEVMPRLRINDVYAQILKRSRGGPGGSLTSQLQEARWLVKNVQQRFDTIQRVAQAIVERQRAFFTHGAVAMRPLVLREIADALGLHESTVSRVTTQKYMLTPFGTFEMKYFFGSHVATDTGGAASSTAIRALIKQLVTAEDSRQPLSDSRIAELLGEQGIVVARRTVAKYREALRIPPVAQRKSL
ncbi:MAG TPA: RNA polymerase factor sigma-54 [Burkholderiaceae bacterium]|nr:RNA polymerase factor sigma-54 [Burkholderiaceae bacterium]